MVVALAALSAAWGGKVILEMPIDVFPDLNRPTVTLLAEAGGLAPEEVETLIATPIETAMSGLPGVIRVRSASSIGLSIIWVEFDWGTDLLINRQLVGEKLAIVRDTMPEGVVPIMGPISSLLGEIMLVGLSSPAMDSMDVRTVADWTIKPRLQSIPGVAQVVPIGGGLKQIQILVKPKKLKEYGITFDQVRQAAQHIGHNTTGGFVQADHQELLIRNLGRPHSIDEIEATVVAMVKNVPIQLKHVAAVKYAPQVKRGDASINATPGVIMAVQKQPGVNTVTLTRQVEAALKELRSSMPSGIEIHELFKQATFIEVAIANVEEALLDGSIFVAIVLFLFLMNFRTTAITLTAIPLSLVITFLILKWFGIGINTMTLGGLAVAIGELVDDAIVDVENVFRRLKENRAAGNPKSVIKVVYEASSEVRNSIVIATMIVVLVFLPLFSLDGLEGRLFVPLGIAYVVSILASLLVSLTITPVLCSYLLPKVTDKNHEEDGAFVRSLKKKDRAVLEKVLDTPKQILAVCAVLVVIAGVAVAFMGREFLPPFNEGTVTAFVSSPPGTSLGESNRIGSIAERQLLKVPEINKTSRRTGRAEEDEHAEGVYNSEIDVDLQPSDRTRSEILGDIRSKLKEVPGVAVSLGQPISHRLDHMLSGVKAQIAIKIFGDDNRTLRSLADEVKAKIGGVEGLVDLEVEKVTLVPQIQFVPDHAKATRFGLTSGAVVNWLEEALSGGHTIGEVLEGQKRIGVAIRLEDQVKTDLTSLGNIPIDTPTGGMVPLHAIGRFQQTTGPNAVNHENGRRRIVVMANTHERDLGSVVNDIQAVLARDVKVPDGYYINMGGQFESQISATRAISTLSVLSLFGVFLVLFMHFKSAQLAGLVLLNIPLALIGSVIAVYLTGGVFSVGTLVGFITLCGIASRNGIMMVSHYLHLMQHEGHSFTREMVIKGSLERLVPVLMTALTAALALTPIAFGGSGAGKEILHPVAVVILGGLLSSTLLDIFVTPVVFFNYGRKAAAKSLAASGAGTQSDAATPEKEAV
jgi:HME family heavy-metal exporter